MAKRDQAHQRVLQIRSTRSAVQAYKDACRILQKYTRSRKSEWWEMKAEELQRADDRNDMKGFYSGLKEVWGPQTKQPVHLKSSDGLEIFTDSKSVMARWSEYFQKLLNVSGDIEPAVLENIQKRSVNTALDEKSTMDEMVRAINGLKDGKAPGGDGIPAEVWKYIVTIYKKGDRTECGNYRGISILSAAARILLNRMNLKPHYPRDTVQLSFKQKHSRHDLLPTTTHSIVTIKS